MPETADSGSDKKDKIEALAGKGTVYSAAGVAILYLFGYLALRFQLTLYGVATNLDAFDERYLFAGCRFVVYLALAIPNLLVILGAVLLPLYLLFKALPEKARDRMRAFGAARLASPRSLLFGACLLALILIQSVYRQCVLLSDMLLRAPARNFWVYHVLLAGGEPFYFVWLLLGVFISGAALVFSLRLPWKMRPRLLTALLAVLFAIEFLLLPVNYGILIGSGQLPRVSQIENPSKLSPGASAWLVWESKEALVLLVCENNSRSLVTFPKKENRVSIVAYEPVFQAVTRPPCASQ
jgi:hypothetical protein